MIRLELHVEINFYFNLILNYEACKLSKHFLKFVFEIFPAKSCCEFRSYPSGVIVVEGFGCGRAKGPPIVQTFGEPNDNDPEGVQAI